jgi:hypothetical protein
MFVENIENMFEGLGLFKYPPTTYNDEVLNGFINMSLHMFFSLELFHMMHNMVPSTLIYLFNNNFKSIILCLFL